MGRRFPRDDDDRQRRHAPWPAGRLSSVKAVVLEHRDRAAIAQHIGAVRALDDLLDFRRHHEHREAGPGEFADQSLDLGLGTDVDAARGLVEDQELGVGAKPSGQQDLLLVAARQFPDRLLGTGAFDAEAFDEAIHDRPLARLVDDPQGREPRHERERQVLPHRQVRHDPFVLAVFRAEAQPRRDGGAGFPRRIGPTVERDLARIGPVGPEQKPHALGPARTEQPRQTDDLARTDREAHVVDERRAAQAARFDDGTKLGRRFGRFGPEPGRTPARHRGEVPPQHGGHEVELRHLGHGADPDGGAVAHDGDAVADREELIELMTDEDRRDAVALQAPDHGEQALDLAVVERRGGLVHDHELGLEADRASDGDHLLGGDGIGVERTPNVDLEIEPSEQRAGFGLHATAVEQAQAAEPAAEPDVLGDRAKADEVDLLVDGGDPLGLGVAGRRGLEGPTVERHLAPVAAVKAGQDLDERRLAGPVLPHQGVDFASRDIERRVAQGRHRAEALGDVAHAETRRWRGGRDHDGRAILDHARGGEVRWIAAAPL